jgi:hypothetical protein
MGEKWDKVVGNFEVVVDGKEYPFSMTLRQRGVYNNLRMKMDNEAILMFLYERFKDGFLNTVRALGKEATVGDLEECEKELTPLFLTRYEFICTEVMICLGIMTREQHDKMQKNMEEASFLESFLEAKLGEKKKEGVL